MKQAAVKRVEIYHPSRFFHDRLNENLFVRIAARWEEKIIEGWGESSTFDPSLTGQTANIIADDFEYRISPAIIGKKIGTAKDIAKIIEEILPLRKGMETAAAAADNALFDLLGKLVNQPVYKILWDYAYPGQEFPDLPDLLPVKLECNSFINASKVDDFEGLIRIIKLTRGEKIVIVDPFFQGLPCPAEGIKKSLGSQALRDMTLVSDWTLTDFQKLKYVIENKCVDAQVIRINRQGGFTFLIRVLKLIEKNNRFKLAIRPMMETGIGAHANIHAALASIGAWDLNLGFILKNPKTIIEKDTETIGMVKTSDVDPFKIIESAGGKKHYRVSSFPLNKPGLGFEVNMDYLEKVTQKASVIFEKDGKITIRRFPYRKGKPDLRNISQEII